MFILVHPDERAIIEATPALADLALRMKQDDEHRLRFEDQIEQARVDYAMGSDDDLEIDDTPALSVADDGVWVSAWVWVRLKDEEEENES